MHKNGKNATEPHHKFLSEMLRPRLWKVMQQILVQHFDYNKIKMSKHQKDISSSFSSLIFQKS